MFGPPCTASVDTAIFFWVWLYSINPHENDRKKVRGVYDGSTGGGQIMVHGATYAPIPQHIDVCLQIDIVALQGMCIWYADVTNAFTEAGSPEQIYYMRCDHVFREWRADNHPDIALPPDMVVPVLDNIQGHPEDPRLWEVRCHDVFVMLKFKNTTYAPSLYQGTFNDEFVLFLRMVNDFSIMRQLEDTYTKLCTY
jgi:hypothetical protein